MAEASAQKHFSKIPEELADFQRLITMVVVYNR